MCNSDFIKNLSTKGLDDISGGALRALLNVKNMTVICDAFDRKIEECANDLNSYMNSISTVCAAYRENGNVNHIQMSEIHIACDYISEILDDIEQYKKCRSDLIDFTQNFEV